MRFKGNFEALRRLFRFVGTGVAGVATYYVVYVPLVKLLGIWYVLASTLAFVCFMGVNFTLHRHWTFRDRDISRPFSRQLGFYVLLHSVNQVINLVGLYLLIDQLGWGKVAAQVPLTAYFALSTWVIYNKWIFRK